jgi:hypothetical protein
MDSTVLYIAGGVATAIGTVSWWAFRSMHSRVGSLEREMAEYKLHVAETYAPNTALEKAMDRCSQAIDAVFRKLDAMDEKFDRRLRDKADRD